MGIRNKVTGEFYAIAAYDPSTGNVTGITNTGGNTDLGNVSTVFIGGGNPGEVLSTDGTGNLNWIPDGGGADTGNVTFDNVTVQGDNFLNLSAGPDYTANLAYLQLRAGDFPSHIHLDTGDSTAYDLYIGNDQKFVQVSSTGNIVMSSYDGGTSHQWNMDNTGNLNLPTNGNINFNSGNIYQTQNEHFYVIIKDQDDDGWGLYNRVNDGNDTTLSQTRLQRDVFTITTDYNNDGYEWSFDNLGRLNLPGNIQGAYSSNTSMYAINTGVDGGSVELKLISFAGDTLISNMTVSNPNVTISTASATNTWTFDNTGNLTLPVGGLLVVSGGIVGGGASPAPYLSGFSSLATVGAQGNITASGFFKGDGGYLSNIAGGNVVGEVALANTVSNPAQPNITSVGTLVSLTTGALNTTGQFTANGNTQFNGDVFFTGNVTLPGNINQISGNSASFFGDPATGFGALYVGLPTGYTLLDNEVAQFSDNFNGYTQVTHRNINGGDQATGDFVITADNGDDLTNHIDLGIAGSGYDGALANNSLGTVLNSNDGYLYTRGNVTGGNLVLGSNQTNGVVRIIANGASNIGDVVATFRANGLTVASNVAASYFLGNGSQLTSIAGSSVTGTVANATFATTAGSSDSVAGANVSGQVSNALVSGTVYTAAQPNITSVGTLTNLDVTGNVTTGFIIGDGSQLTNLPVPSPSIGTMVSGANITPAATNVQYNVTALAEATFVITPAGTAVDGAKLTIRIRDNGTSQLIFWEPTYVPIGTTLPAATVAGKYVYVGCIYNAQSETWDVVSVAQEA